jgi:hypothetical protein
MLYYRYEDLFGMDLIGVVSAMSAVSVVIPTYNRPQYLDITLQAILNQTVLPREVIVVDDGSTVSGAEEVVGKWGSIAKYHRVVNGGQSVARNIGVGQATGDWVAFCDDDDLWQPTYLAEMLQAMSTVPDSKFGFCNFRFVQEEQWSEDTKFTAAPSGYWEDTNDPTGLIRVFSSGSILKKLVKFQPIFPSATIIQRSHFANIGGYNPAFTRIGSEDLDLTLRAVAEGPVVALATPLVGIRKHDSNFSGSLLKILVGEIQILREALAQQPALALHRAAFEERLRQLTLNSIDEAFSIDQFHTVRELCATPEAKPMGYRRQLKRFFSTWPTPLARSVRRLLAPSHT